MDVNQDCLLKKDYWGAYRAVMKALANGLGDALNSSVAFTKDAVASLEGHPMGDKIRKGLMVTGFLDPVLPEDEAKKAAE